MVKRSVAEPAAARPGVEEDRLSQQSFPGQWHGCQFRVADLNNAHLIYIHAPNGLTEIRLLLAAPCFFGRGVANPPRTGPGAVLVATKTTLKEARMKRNQYQPTLNHAVHQLCYGAGWDL